MTRSYFSHTTPGGTTFVDSLISLGVTGVVGEILGRTNVSPEESVESVAIAFTRSPSHNLHVVYPTYEVAGVGFATTADGMQYFTVIFQLQPKPREMIEREANGGASLWEESGEAALIGNGVCKRYCRAALILSSSSGPADVPGPGCPHHPHQAFNAGALTSYLGGLRSPPRPRAN